MTQEESIKIFTDDNFHKEIEKGITLVDFHAVWCAPCRMLGPIIDQVVEQFKGKLKVGKIDIDSEQKVATEYQVTSIPTLIFFKEGKEINRLVGLRDFSSIKEIVEKEIKE